MFYIFLVNKKMTLYHDLIDIASKKSKMLSFYYFVNDTHETVECDKQICNFLLFLTPLQEVLCDGYKRFEEQRQFFVRHWLKHPEVFHSMFLESKKSANVGSAIFGKGTKNVKS